MSKSRLYNMCLLGYTYINISNFVLNGNTFSRSLLKTKILESSIKYKLIRSLNLITLQNIKHEGT